MAVRPIVASVVTILGLACAARSAGGEVVRLAPAATGVDLCSEIHREEGIDDVGAMAARFHCEATSRGAWALRIDAPEDGTRDLRVVTIHAEQGARTRATQIVRGAAVWFPTLAPLARGVTVRDLDGDGEADLMLRLTRIGFAETEVASLQVLAR